MNVRRLFTAVVLAATALVAHAAGPLKFGYGNADDHPLGAGARRFAELVKERSGGRLTVTVYSSNRLGSDPQMQQGLQAGVQELMTGPTSNLVGLVRDFAVFDLPFSIGSYKEADAMLDGETGQMLLRKLEPHGLVGLAYFENGFRNITNSKRPVVKADDIAGLKIRVMQNPVFLDTFKALGANAIPMPFTEVYGALETRAVDAQENPVAAIQGGKLYEVQKYLSLTNHVYNPNVVMASKKWWDALPVADQQIVRQSALDAAVHQRQTSRAQAGKITEFLKAQGMQVNELSSDELARIRAKVQPVVSAFSQQIDPAVLAQARKDLATIR